MCRWWPRRRAGISKSSRRSAPACWSRRTIQRRWRRPRSRCSPILCAPCDGGRSARCRDRELLRRGACAGGRAGLSRIAGSRVSSVAIVIESFGGGGAQHVASALANHWSGQDIAVTAITFAKPETDVFTLDPRVRRIVDRRQRRFGKCDRRSFGQCCPHSRLACGHSRKRSLDRAELRRQHERAGRSGLARAWQARDHFRAQRSGAAIARAHLGPAAASHLSACRSRDRQFAGRDRHHEKLRAGERSCCGCPIRCGAPARPASRWMRASRSFSPPDGSTRRRPMTCCWRHSRSLRAGATASSSSSSAAARLRGALEAQARELKIADRVSFMGRVEDPFPFYRAALALRSSGAVRGDAQCRAGGHERGPAADRQRRAGGTARHRARRAIRLGRARRSPLSALAAAMIRLMDEPQTRDRLCRPVPAPASRRSLPARSTNGPAPSSPKARAGIAEIRRRGYEQAHLPEDPEKQQINE